MVEKKRYQVTLNKLYRDAIDKLIEEGLYMDKQAVIKDALRLLFRLYRIEPFPFDLTHTIEDLEGPRPRTRPES